MACEGFLLSVLGLGFLPSASREISQASLTPHWLHEDGRESLSPSPPALIHPPHCRLRGPKCLFHCPVTRTSHLWWLQSPPVKGNGFGQPQKDQDPGQWHRWRHFQAGAGPLCPGPGVQGLGSRSLQVLAPCGASPSPVLKTPASFTASLCSSARLGELSKAPHI